MANDKAKDGVTLIADAIRKEQAEALEKASKETRGNVIDATKQFSNGGKKPEEKPEPESNDESESNGEPDESNESNAE